HRMVGGQQLFAKLKLKLEPIVQGQQAVSVLNMVPYESMPAELVTAAMEELKSCAQGGGVLGGFPLINMKCTVVGGETADVGSTDVAFAIAAHDAFEQGLRQGGPVLLEPIMRLQITTPEDYLGDFIGDLQQRRATISHTENRGEISQIEAHAPLAELFGYSSAMRSLSQGRASCSMEPLNYAPAPASVADSFGM
ncbi:MAG: elongation factor G, partial [Planctomycetales bacterium]|nr:elongation factor G [Planctomycetales bacterium]